MRPLLRAVFLTSIAAVLSSIGGCGSDESKDTAPVSNGSGGSTGTGGSGGKAGSSSGFACDEPASLDMNGIFFTLVRLQTDLHTQVGGIISLCPEEQSGTADLFAIVTVTQDGTSLPSVKTTVCDFTLPQATAVVGSCDPKNAITAQVHASAALAHELPLIGTGEVKGTLGGTTPGATFEAETLTFVMGSKSGGSSMAKWKPSSTCDNFTDPKGVGTTCEPECVTDCNDVEDDDKDTFPGITMTVCGTAPDEAPGATCHVDDPSIPGVILQGRAFLNFQVDPKLSGVANSSCEFSGKVDAAIIYNVIGGDVRLSGGNPLPITPVTKAIPLFDVNADLSKFVARRVDGKFGTDDWSLDPADPVAACQIALMNKNSLF
jgi:hypothetical protein